ncbi:MAG: hypothetical protein KDA80_11555 [Planctomycetaceae bacterium]|nr:hypothetical protein [Planctomycetaceae bacterium]
MWTCTILAVTDTVAFAQGQGRAAVLKLEKAALEERLAEIELELDRLWAGDGIEFLGMSLVPFSEELAKKYELPDLPFRGPFITHPPNDGVFLENTAPQEGCVLLFVEHPAKAFAFNENRSPRHTPKTVRQFLQGVNACTITPDMYSRIWETMISKARERAVEAEDQSEEQKRWLKVAAATMPDGDVGKYVCRVVYYDAKINGTMTTYLRLTESDLKRLDELLAE